MALDHTSETKNKCIYLVAKKVMVYPILSMYQNEFSHVLMKYIVNEPFTCLRRPFNQVVQLSIGSFLPTKYPC